MLRSQRGDQESAIASTADADVSRGGVALIDEVLRRRGEVIEDILFVLQHTGVVPRLAELTSPAQVGQRVDATVLCPGHGRGGETGKLAEIEAAVAGEQRRVRSVPLKTFLIHDEHRNARAVL